MTPLLMPTSQLHPCSTSVVIVIVNSVSHDGSATLRYVEPMFDDSDGLTRLLLACSHDWICNRRSLSQCAHRDVLHPVVPGIIHMFS